ncbi:MAG: hypothetical protein ACE5OS_04560 [Anaerolineae bacterium]
MKSLGPAIRLMLCLPPVWIALVTAGIVVAVNGWEPCVDIALYAVQRLFQ